jgi:hypothetical protein
LLETTETDIDGVTKDTCPYCGSENIMVIGENGKYFMDEIK